MATVHDRVKEDSATTGTGDFALGGAFSGFSAFGDVYSIGDQTFYVIESDAGEFEVGRGTYSAANTLSRNEVFSSSNNDELVNFIAGTKTVFVSYPAKRAVTDQIAIQFAIGLGG